MDVACSPSQSYGHLDKRVAKPPYPERLLCVRDCLVTDVLTRSVVDLHAALLDDVDQHDDSTAGLHPPARQAHALEIEVLAYTGRQQSAIHEITDGAGARPVRRE